MPEDDTKMSPPSANEDGSTVNGRTPWWVYCRSSPPTLGRWGEWVALRHLRSLGWEVVARNWRGYSGEVDLIAYDENFLVFVEVKTRRMPSLLAPEENVDIRKERKIEQLAMEFLVGHEMTDTPLRFDVIAIQTEDTRNFQLRHFSLSS